MGKKFIADIVKTAKCGYHTEPPLNEGNIVIV